MKAAGNANPVSSNNDETKKKAPIFKKDKIELRKKAPISKKDKVELKKKHPCKQCVYSSNYSSHLKMHVEVVHEGLKRFGCDQCEFRCAERNKMETHDAGVHGNERKVSCDRCDLKFKTRVSLRAHIKIVHERHRLAKCAQCNYFAKSQWVVRDHARAVHERPLSLACDIVDCNYRTDRRQNLKNHLWSTHLKRSLRKTYQCLSCNHSAETERTLQDHVDFVHNKNFKYVCGSCDHCARSKKALQDHVDFKHERNFKYSCDVCDVPYPSRARMEYHKNVVHAEFKTLYCEQCQGFATNRNLDLENHMLLMHLDVPEEKCALCSFGTRSRKLMKFHKMSHNKSRAINGFECDVAAGCVYRGASLITLSRHTREKHTEKKDHRRDDAGTERKVQDKAEFMREKTFKPLVSQETVESRNKRRKTLVRLNEPPQDRKTPREKVETRKRYHCGRCKSSYTTGKELEDHVDLFHDDRDVRGLAKVGMDGRKVMVEEVTFVIKVKQEEEGVKEDENGVGDINGGKYSQ